MFSYLILMNEPALCEHLEATFFYNLEDANPDVWFP